MQTRSQTRVAARRTVISSNPDSVITRDRILAELTRNNSSLCTRQLTASAVAMFKIHHITIRANDMDMDIGQNQEIFDAYNIINSTPGFFSLSNKSIIRFRTRVVRHARVLLAQCLHVEKTQDIVQIQKELRRTIKLARRMCQ